MFDLTAAFAADALTPPEPTNDELQQIASLAEQQLCLEGKVAALEEQLKAVVEQLRDISEKALPEAMAAVGMKKFTLTDGSTIDVKDDLAASIRADQKPRAIAWLDNNGFGDVVKDEVKIALGKGEAQFAPQITQFVQGLGFNATETFSVHPSTLKSLVKEQLKKGLEFPECFSIHQYQKAVITRPKGR